MKLPFSLKLDKKKPALFLVLVLRDEKIDAVIFEEQARKAKVVGQHEEYFQTSIDSLSLEEFLDILDRAISKAESSLPDNYEPQNTIFGVKESWIEKDKINKDCLMRLKKACDELGLTPIGFLIISQAISYLLQKEDGAPLSAILVDAGKSSITVSLIRGGKIIETKSKNIENNIPSTVDDLLKQFTTQEALPSRIIVFNGEKDLNFEFISHQWSKSLPFLHLPQITSLSSDVPARAVLFGVATQMGFDVLDDVVKEKKSSKENPPQEFQNLPMESFGFVKDKDIAQEQPDIPLSVSASQSFVPQPPSHTTSDAEKHIPTSLPLESPLVQGEQNELPAKSEMEADKPDFQVKSAAKTDGGLNFIKTSSEVVKTTLGSARGAFSKISQSFPSFLFPINSKKAVFIPALIVILLIGSFVFYLFGTKTTVLLDIKPKVIKQDKNITFSTDLQADEKNSIVSGKSVSVSLEGEVSMPTSGKKEIGTKAKGEVTIFNNTNSSKTFPKGTTIASSNDLNFVLEDSVTVASASGDVFSGTTPGKANVAVLASSIGTEFNLPSNTKFSTGDNPSIAGKNDDPFSGGTKKEISVVSQSDIDKLLEELPKKLREKAEEEFPKKISKDETLLPVVLVTTITKKNFDKDVNDEGDRVTLKGTVVYKALSYNKKELISQSASSLKKNVSQNQTLDEDDVKIDVKNIKKKNEKEIEALLSLEAFLKPKVDEKKLIEEITGISYKDAEKILMELPQAANVRISSSLELPYLPKILPRISENIKIIVNVK